MGVARRRRNRANRIVGNRHGRVCRGFKQRILELQPQCRRARPYRCVHKHRRLGQHNSQPRLTRSRSSRAKCCGRHGLFIFLGRYSFGLQEYCLGRVVTSSRRWCQCSASTRANHWIQQGFDAFAGRSLLCVLMHVPTATSDLKGWRRRAT